MIATIKFVIIIIITVIIITTTVIIIICHIYAGIYNYIPETHQFSRACKIIVILCLRFVVLAKYVCSVQYSCFSSSLMS
jgi:hypothetical protein